MRALAIIESKPQAAGDALLTVDGLTSAYSRIQVLHGVSIQVPPGELVALVGANGAGKTTLLRCISGVQPISAGSVLMQGKPITGASADARVRAGVCQVPEGRHVFAPMTIEDNLRMGAHTRPAAEIADGLEEVFTLFPVLRERRHQPAGVLSGGQQQMVALGRALMGKPRLLLLDEPSMGLAPLIVADIFRIIRMLRDTGMTILLVEQNARAALSIADHAYVMESGRIALQGRGRDLLKNDEVRRAYLGMLGRRNVVAQQRAVRTGASTRPQRVVSRSGSPSPRRPSCPCCRRRTACRRPRRRNGRPRR